MSYSSQHHDIMHYMQYTFKPKPKLTGSEWMDMHFYLIPSSANAGKWKTKPWQKEIIDVMCDSSTHTVVLKKPTRVGFTKILTGVKAYFIHQRPCNILDYHPNMEEAKGYVEDEFEPMLKEVPVVSALVEKLPASARNKREKTLKKRYSSFAYEALGAESERNLNRRTAKVVCADELDAFKKEAGKTGDIVTQMMRRNSDFWDRKTILGGKPVGGEYEEDREMDESMSVVDYWFKMGDQRIRHYPCPHCHHYQTFHFHDMIWNKDIDENGKTIKHYPTTAHFECVECKEPIYYHHKHKMDRQGRWIATKPYNGIASFHIWAFISDSPNVTWRHIVEEFLISKKSKAKFKAFKNEVLAETWEEDYEKIEIDSSNRTEEYRAEVPMGVLVLTGGVDVQKDRLELEVVGWGKSEESWSIDYKIFNGPTDKDEVWEKLDNFLIKNFYHEDGSEMKIYSVAIDTGYRATRAYRFGKIRFNRGIFVIKGANSISAPLVPRVASISKKSDGAKFYSVGVNEGKNIISSYILTQQEGPGYMHFPNKPIYNEEYFKQLSAEKRQKNGRWEKIRARNEAFDVRNYAYIALYLANVDLELLALNSSKLGVMISRKITYREKRDNAKDFADKF